MPNQYRASYEIKIGESEYTLRPTFEAIAEFQSKAGMGVFEGIASLEGQPNVVVVVSAILAGIKGEAIFQGDTSKVPSFEKLGQEVMNFGINKVIFEAYAFLQRAITADDQKKSLEEGLEKVKALALKMQTLGQGGGDSQAP